MSTVVNEVFARALANRIIVGQMTIEQVPTAYKEAVEAVISDQTA